MSTEERLQGNMTESANSMERSVPRFLAFGEWTADLEAGEIRCGRERVRLQKKPFLILSRMLVQAAEDEPRHVFDRAELWILVWPEFPLDGDDLTISEANNVNTAIRKIRLAFGDDLIETVRGFGYRYAGPPVRVVDTGEPNGDSPRWRSLTPMATLAVIGIVAVVVTMTAWKLWPGPQPRTAEVDGEYLVVRDDEGETLWAKPLQPDAAYRYSNPHGPQGCMMLVEDLDQDGSTEVVVTWPDSEILRGHSSVVCFEPDGDRRWVAPVGRPLRLGMREFRDAFTPWIMGVAQSRDGPRLVVNSHQDPYFPAQILFLDVESGEPVGEYLHPGHVYTFAIDDLDGDGVSEVLVAGINNPGDGHGYPFLAVLSPDRVEGSVRPGPFSFPETHLQDYFLFPRPSLYDAVGERVQIRDVHIEDGTILMRVGIDEILVTLSQDFATLGGYVGDRFRERFLTEFGEYPEPEEVDRWSRPVRFESTPLGNSEEVHRLMRP